MKTLILLSTLIFLVSCGKGPRENSSGPKIDSIQADLTQDEETLVNDLKDAKALTQKELIKKFMNLKSFNHNTLKKLDAFLQVECLQSSGVCHITNKD